MTRSAASLDVLLPCSIFVDRVRTPVKDLVNAGAEHVFAFYLEGQVDEKLTINGVNSAHYTKKLRVHELREHQELL